MSDNNELILRLKAVDELSPVLVNAVQMMTENSARITDAIEKIGSKSNSTKEPVEGLNAGMLNLAAGVTVATEAYEIAHKVWEKVEAQIEKSIEEAVEAEKAQNKLTGALVSQGLYVGKVVHELDRYVETLEKSKGINGEQTKVLLAQSIQMGLSVTQAKAMEEASRKLAVAQGIDANSAFSLLSGAVAGQTRGLQKIIPEVKNLTASQLKNGEAAVLVNKALDAQYKLYEGSYSAGLTKAHTAVDNVYKAVGQMITQNPLVLKGIEKFGELAGDLAEKLDDAATWLRGNSAAVEMFGDAVEHTLAAAAAGAGVWAIAAAAAAAPTVTLATALGVLFGPITLGIAAVTGLTYAFMKWPGLWDQIVGGIKMFAATFIEGMASILNTASKVAGVFDKDLAASINRARDNMMAYSDKLGTAGGAQMNLGERINETSTIIVKSVEEIRKEEKALDKNMEAASRKAAVNRALAASYAGILLGTEAARSNLLKETQTRDADLKRFEDYLEAKKRLAISKAQEEQLQLAKARAGMVGDTGGEQSIKAKADYEIQVERQKQAELTAMQKKGVITKAQLDEEVYESNQRIKQKEIVAEQSHQQALADLLGNGPAGFEAQAEIRKKAFDQKLAEDTANAQRLGMSEQEIEKMRQERLHNFQNQERDTQKAHDEEMIQLATETRRRKAEALGETPEALELKKQIEQQEFQMHLQNKLLEAQQEGATDAEIKAMREQQELEHRARLTEIEVEYWNRQAELQDKAGNDWESFQARRRASVAQHGAIMGNLQAVQNSQYYKGEMQMLTDLSTLRNSKSKHMFEVGKGAAIAQATVNTFMAATSAYAAMASIPIVGPVLGALAAAAAIAAGTVNIQQIKSQNYQGQAHGGMDEIPQSMNNSTFILKAGERVVQPEANRDLTAFLEGQKQGATQSSGKGGNTYNVTVNAGAVNDPRKLTEMIVREIREMSARGTPIMSTKGLVDG